MIVQLHRLIVNSTRCNLYLTWPCAESSLCSSLSSASSISDLSTASGAGGAGGGAAGHRTEYHSLDFKLQIGQ